MNTDQTTPEESPKTPESLVALWSDRERRYSNSALVALPGEEEASDSASSEAYRTCAMELRRILPDLQQSTADRYRALIHSTVERTCVKRIEEIEGRVPTVEEIREHGQMNVTKDSGITVYLWKGVPICEFRAAGYTPNGWRDAVISECRPAFAI